MFVCGDDRRGKLGLQTSGPSGDSRCVWLPTEVSRFRNSGISVYAAASGGCHSVLLGVPDPHAPPASPCTPPPGALQHELSPTESSATASLEAPRPHGRRRPRDEVRRGYGFNLEQLQPAQPKKRGGIQESNPESPRLMRLTYHQSTPTCFRAAPHLSFI